MQKFYLKYIDEKNNEYYVETADLDKRVSLTFTPLQHKATIFYSDAGMQIISDLIKNDKATHSFSDTDNYCYKIEAMDKQALHHFELIDAVINEFGENNLSGVHKDFPLLEGEEYTDRDKDGRPIIDSLSHWELQRYYDWLKENNPNHIMEPAGIACAHKNGFEVNEVREISKIRIES